MDGLTNGGGAQHHFIQPEPALSLSKNSAPNTTAIDNRLLAQVDTLIAHKLTVQSDIEYVRHNLKSNLPQEILYANQTLELDQLLRSLDVGQALVSNTETERALLVDIRPRVSVHGGF
jgi:hypothetical protein